MRYNTVGIIVLCAIGLLVAPRVALAQKPGAVYRVGYLAIRPTIDEALREALPQLGYVEGHNLVLEGRFAQGQYERLPDLAAELVQLQVEVIVAVLGAPALAAKHVTSTVPIVFLVGTDPVALGLVASLARPGGNLTGVAALAREVMGKRLQLLKEAVPGATRVAALFQPGDPLYQTPALREGPTREAQALGLMLRWVEVRDPNEFEETFAVMSRERFDAFVLSASGVYYAHRTHVVDLAAQHRLPALYIERGWVEAGGLMSYASSLSHVWQRVATYVDKILKGAKPTDLPVEQSMQFELVLNRKTAQALGITFPPTLLIQADEVIQ